jgi:hypothetical protein
MTRNEQHTPQIGDAAPGVTIRDTDGHPLELAALWRDQPVALVFIRHFG